MFKLIVLSMLMSCGVQPPKKEIKEPIFVFNSKFWIGKSESDLILHPLYAVLPMMEKSTGGGIEVKAFKQDSKSVSNSSCYGALGCQETSQNIDCNHVFYLKNKRIYNYTTVGNCGNLLSYRPYDEYGNPMMTAEEAEAVRIYEAEMSALAKHNSPKEKIMCESRSDCPDGMTCKISSRGEEGICGHYGLMGKILYQ